MNPPAPSNEGAEHAHITDSPAPHVKGSNRPSKAVPCKRAILTDHFAEALQKATGQQHKDGAQTFNGWSSGNTVNLAAYHAWSLTI